MQRKKLSKKEVRFAINDYIERQETVKNKQVKMIKIITSRAYSCAPVPQRVLRDVPFVCSKRASLIKKNSEGVTIEIVASKLGPPTDKDMLLAVHLFFEAFEGLSKLELAEVAAGKGLAEIKIPTSQLRWWHQGKIKNLTIAAARLVSHTTIYTLPDGQSITHRFFSECKINGNVLTALIDRDAAVRTLQSPWNIDVMMLKQIVNSVARALFLMLAPDHRPKYNVLEIAGRLGMPTESTRDRLDTIDDIISGFKDLEKTGILTILENSDRKNIYARWSEMKQIEL